MRSVYNFLMRKFGSIDLPQAEFLYRLGLILFFGKAIWYG